MTDAELRDAAWAELVLTTIGWLKPNGQARPTPGTHWKNAKALLDQIGVAPPPPPPPPPPPANGVPIPANGVITTGGVYTGAHNGLIDVQTTALVTFANCTITNTTGTNLISAVGAGKQVVLDHCTFTGGPKFQTSGRLIEMWQQKSLEVKNCTIQGTRGIELSLGDPTGHILVTRNRHTDPAGGDVDRYGSGALADFVQFRVCHAASIEVSWNEIVQHYQPALDGPTCMDTISIYHTSGVHCFDNMLWHQSLPGNLDGTGQPNGQYSSQGGITLDESDRAGDPVSNCLIERNQVIDGYGIVTYTNFAGSNNLLKDNRIVADGFLPDGSKTHNSWGSPLTILKGSGTNNHAHDNYVSYRDRLGNQPLDSYGGGFDNFAAQALNGAAEGGNAEWHNNTYVANPTKASEDAEWTLWQQKLTVNGITIGAA